jgi:hypothetical protein
VSLWVGPTNQILIVALIANLSGQLKRGCYVVGFLDSGFAGGLFSWAFTYLLAPHHAGQNI